MNEDGRGRLNTGLTEDVIKGLFRQGLEDLVSEYSKKVANRAIGISSYNHWGDIPDAITVGLSTYTPPQILEHFSQGDVIGLQLLERMRGHFLKSRIAAVAAFGLAGHIEEKESTVRLYAGNKEITSEEVFRDARSLNLEVNPILRMAIYDAVKSIYLTPEETGEVSV
jgi:hypothetical protein